MSHASALIQQRIVFQRRVESESRLDFARATAPVLANAFNAQRVWVFGSAARGVASNGSDVDLMVEGGEGMSAKERLAIAYEAIVNLDSKYSCDVIVLTEEEVFQKSSLAFFKQLIADRKLVYGK